MKMRLVLRMIPYLVTMIMTRFLEAMVTQTQIHLLLVSAMMKMTSSREPLPMRSDMRKSKTHKVTSI